MGDAAEPMARHTVFTPWRAAAVDLWGDGWARTLARQLPDDVRRDTVDAHVLETWLPERYVIAWHHAVWELVKRDQAELHKFIHLGMKHGFGRMRRVLVSIALSPLGLVERAADMWREEHTHGLLVATPDGKRAATLTLAEHPYTGNDLSAEIVAESVRHAASFARARNVTASHHVDRGVLHVDLRWD